MTEAAATAAYLRDFELSDVDGHSMRYWRVRARYASRVSFGANVDTWGKSGLLYARDDDDGRVVYQALNVRHMVKQTNETSKLTD